MKGPQNAIEASRYLSRRPQGPWLVDPTTLSDEAAALILAYNDLGLVPQIEEGVIVGVAYKRRQPLWEGELE